VRAVAERVDDDRADDRERRRREHAPPATATPASLARMPCGIAVPSVSMPTSQPSAAAGTAPTHWTIIFMPSG
jgi:hypothetical protein